MSGLHSIKDAWRILADDVKSLTRSLTFSDPCRKPKRVALQDLGDGLGPWLIVEEWRDETTRPRRPDAFDDFMALRLARADALEAGALRFVRKHGLLLDGEYSHLDAEPLILYRLETWRIHWAREIAMAKTWEGAEAMHRIALGQAPKCSAKGSYQHDRIRRVFECGGEVVPPSVTDTPFGDECSTGMAELFALVGGDHLEEAMVATGVLAWESAWNIRLARHVVTGSVGVQPGGLPVLGARAKNLLGALWLRATAPSSEDAHPRLTACLNPRCGTFFAKLDPRQKYCPECRKGGKGAHVVRRRAKPSSGGG